MAITEQNGLMTFKDESGNKTLLYPVTKKECVDGMDDVDAHLADRSNPHEVTSGQIKRTGGQTVEAALIALEGRGAHTGTADPTKTTAGRVGDVYVNTASKTVFHCVSASAGKYTWVSGVLPEILVSVKKNVTVTATDGTATYSAVSDGQAKFPLPGYGTWTVSATIGGKAYTKTVDVNAAAQFHVKLGYSTMTAVIDLSNSNPDTCVTYADDAVGMTAEQWDAFFGHYPVLLKNGTEVCRLDRNDYARREDGGYADITSGSEGDVMVAFPIRGLKMTKANNKITIQFTDDPDNPNFKYYAHQRGNARKSVFYIGAYKASGIRRGSSETPGTFCSLSGKSISSGTSLSDARIMAQNLGKGYELSAFYQLLYRQCAYIMKFGSLDSQRKTGKGFVSGSSGVKTGGTDAYGMDSELIKASNPSYMTDGQHQVKCFGIEDFWGNVNEWVDGIHSNLGNTFSISTCTDEFSNNSSTGGPAITNVSGSSSGYMKQPIGSTEAGFIAASGGGSATTYFSDYTSLSSDSFAIFGGAYNEGDKAGMFSLNIKYNNEHSYATNGARLMYL